MPKPYAVTFAGTPGTSKSPVAYYLSAEFNLPIISSDNIRYEVREDLRLNTINKPVALAEYEKRFKARRLGLLALGMPFILDASVDREWTTYKQELTGANYDWFMIDMELSTAFIEDLFLKTDREWAIEQLPYYMAHHETFMAQYGQDVDLQITDETWHKRLQIAAGGLQRFLESDQTAQNYDATG